MLPNRSVLYLLLSRVYNREGAYTRVTAVVTVNDLVVYV